MGVGDGDAAERQVHLQHLGREKRSQCSFKKKKYVKQIQMSLVLSLCTQHTARTLVKLLLLKDSKYIFPVPWFTLNILKCNFQIFEELFEDPAPVWRHKCIINTSAQQHPAKGFTQFISRKSTKQTNRQVHRFANNEG